MANLQLWLQTTLLLMIWPKDDKWPQVYIPLYIIVMSSWVTFWLVKTEKGQETPARSWSCDGGEVDDEAGKGGSEWSEGDGGEYGTSGCWCWPWQPWWWPWWWWWWHQFQAGLNWEQPQSWLLSPLALEARPSHRFDLLVFKQWPGQYLWLICRYNRL